MPTPQPYLALTTRHSHAYDPQHNYPSNHQNPPMTTNSHTNPPCPEPCIPPQKIINMNKIYKKHKPTVTQKHAPDNTTPTKLNPIQSKYKPVPHFCMTPASSIKHHPTFEMLLEYASTSCPVDCGPDWSTEHITATIERGLHLSAQNLVAVASIWAETLEKVAQGYAHIVNWDDIKANPPKNSKFHPLQLCHTKATCSAPYLTCHSNSTSMGNAWQASMRTPPLGQTTKPWSNCEKYSGKS